MSSTINQHINNFFPVEVEYINCLANTIPQIISFIDPINYKITYINRVEEGYTIEKVIGMELFDFILPRYIEKYKQKIKLVKETGRLETIETAFHSFSQPDGLNWYTTTISPVKNADGTIQSLMIMSEDITRSKCLEIENNNKSERLKAIINNTTDVICSIDKDYNLIEFNTNFIRVVKLGYGIELKAGMAVLQFIDPNKHGYLLSIYKRVLNGEINFDIASYETSIGTTVYNETSFHPIYDVDQKITGISIFSKDVTERAKTEQKIKSALREKEILLSEIHHRIKNNLAMISSLLQLQEMNIENIEAKQALQYSRKRVKATALIHELLYKNESFHNINLNDFLNELFNLLKMDDSIQLILKGEDVFFNLNTALPLGLMLNEIMTNSFKHSYKQAIEGKTEISTSYDENGLSIDYCDCQGVFPDSVDFKNSKTTGLTLIHTFAEQLNGSIELVSNDPPKYRIQIPFNEPS